MILVHMGTERPAFRSRLHNPANTGIGVSSASENDIKVQAQRLYGTISTVEHDSCSTGWQRCGDPGWAGAGAGVLSLPCGEAHDGCAGYQGCKCGPSLCVG